MTNYKRRTVLPVQHIVFGPCEHDVKVTRIGDGHNIRVFLNGKLNQEARVFDRVDVAKEIRQMLRMEHKCGNVSGMAASSRYRAGRKLER